MSDETKDFLPAKFQKLSLVDIFKIDTIEKMVQEISKRADEHENDLSTGTGRAAIRSNSFNLTKSKTWLAKQGEKAMAKPKKEIDLIKSGIKKFSDAMDLKRKELNVPVVEYENAYKVRIDAHLANIEVIKEQYPLSEGKSSAEIQEIINSVNAIVVDSSFEEFEDEANLAKDGELEKLKVRFDAEVEREADKAKLEKYEKEEKERKAKEAEVARINSRIDAIRTYGDNVSWKSDIRLIVSAIQGVARIAIDKSFGDLVDVARIAQKKVRDGLLEKLELAQQHEADQAKIAEQKKEADKRIDEEDRKQAIQDVFDRYRDNMPSLINNNNLVVELDKYIYVLECDMQDLSKFQEREDEARKHILSLIERFKSVRSKQVKIDKAEKEKKEDAAKKAKEEAAAATKKEAEEKAEADAMNKAKEDAANVELQKSRIQQTLNEMSDVTGLSMNNILHVEAAIADKFTYLKWVG